MTQAISEPEKVTAFRAKFQRIRSELSRVFVGHDDLVTDLLAAVAADGHVLLEGVPGLGKTLLAKSLAGSLALKFSRIQFTPDLMPADITGSLQLQEDEKGVPRLSFHPGPLLTNFLLADEINRATPRTQSALLECMEEKQVTEGGVTRKLERPFLVIATQNPVETQGTFPLPEAQLDRFLLKLSMGYPDGKEALRIMERFIRGNPLSDLRPVAEREEIIAAHDTFSQCRVSEPVMGYIAALCEATRDKERALLGVSPRGMLALLRVSQAYAAIQGRDYVIPDDVKKLAVPVMAHRVILRGLYGKAGENERFIRELLDKIPAPTETVA